MLKKIAALTCITVMGFSFGVMGVTFAKHHKVAGVDYPYDPTAYYSPTAISWADSAPSRFALEDLAGAGMQVYDYVRHMKSILANEKLMEILGIEKDKSDIEKKNTDNWINHGMSTRIQQTLDVINRLGNTHKDKNGNASPYKQVSSASVADSTRELVEILMESHMDNVTNHDIPAQMENNLFWSSSSMDSEGVGITPTDPYQQHAWIQNACTEIMESAKNIQDDQLQIIAANKYALQLSEEAEGNTQVMGAATFAQTVRTQALVNMSELLNKMVELKMIQSMQRNDDKMHAQSYINSTSYHVVNPTDETSYNYARENYGIEKMQGNGMPDF